MNIETLIQIAKLLEQNDFPSQINPSTIAGQYIGEKVIVRSYSAGNFFGTVVKYEPETGAVIIKDSRRLHRWYTDKGVSLSEIATYGVVAKNSRICTVVPEQLVTEVLELIPCTSAAIQSLETVEVYTP